MTSNHRLKLTLVGDVMLGRLVNQNLYYQPPSYPWGDTLPLFRSSDLNLCNLECVISDRGRPWSMFPKMFHFRTAAKNIAVLKEANIRAVSIANNHVLDFEDEALIEMLRILDEAEVAHAGSGLNDIEASKPALFEAKGIKVGLIAFTDNEPGWEAAEDKPGLFYVPINSEDERAARLFEIVSQTAEAADLVIVSAHWGSNWGDMPEESHVSFARELIDCGASLVFGHSAHVFRGVEIYKSKPIIYSAGDFIDDYAVDEIERNDESFLFTLNYFKGRWAGMSLHPSLIRHFQASLARELKAWEIGAKMCDRCRTLGTEARWNKAENCLQIDMNV